MWLVRVFHDNILHGVAETAATNWFATDISPATFKGSSLIRMFVMFETAGVFSIIVTRSAVAKTVVLNSGYPLSANIGASFDWAVARGDTINFQTSVSGNVTFRVAEIYTGT